MGSYVHAVRLERETARTVDAVMDLVSLVGLPSVSPF